MHNTEIIKDFFNKLASTWDETCHRDNKNLETIANLACIKDDSKVLDIGCGTGIMENYLLQYNPKHILGVDLSDNMIQIAQEKICDDRVEFKVANIYELDIFDYNVAMIYSAYPHFLDKESFIKKIHSCLSENGRIVIAHSESRHKINHVHGKTSDVNAISNKLEEASIEVERLNKYFTIDTIIDTDKIYVISGVKKSI